MDGEREVKHDPALATVAVHELRAVRFDEVREQHHVPAHPGDGLEEGQRAAAGAEGRRGGEEVHVGCDLGGDDGKHKGAAAGRELQTTAASPAAAFCMHACIGHEN